MRSENIPILAGAQIPEGTIIDLIVGKGLGTQQVTVPSLLGKTLTEARSWLIGNSLTVGKLEYDEAPTEETLGQHIVYSQTPSAGEVVRGGSSINLKLTTDLEKIVNFNTAEDEEEFF
jgi:beta-lactam-binding protein with PASTA domain